MSVTHQPTSAPAPAAARRASWPPTRRQAWLVGQAVLVVAAVAVAVALREPTTYTAEAVVLLDADLAGSPAALPAYVQRQAVTAAGPEVADDAAATLGRRVEGVTVQGGTVDLVVTARSDDPEEAAEEADAVARAYLARRGAELEATAQERDAVLAARQARIEEELEVLGGATGAVDAVEQRRRDLRAELAEVIALQRTLGTGAPDELVGRITDPAGEATEHGPRPVRAGLLGAAAGLLVGLGLVLGRASLDPASTPAPARGTATVA